MKILLKNSKAYFNNEFNKNDIAIENNYISKIAPSIEKDGFDMIYNLENLYILPGLIDVHTHLREPGFLYMTIVNGQIAYNSIN